MLLYASRRICSARERLSGVVKPLLQLVSQYTGCPAVSLIAGSVVAGTEHSSPGFVWVAVNHGETDGIVPKNLATFDPLAFKNSFVRTFLSFVRELPGKC